MPLYPPAGGGVSAAYAAGALSPVSLGLAISTGPLPGPTQTSGTNLTNETLFNILATALQTTTINNLAVYLSGAGVTPGVGVNKIAIFSEAGTQLGITGDMTTALEATGWIEAATTAGVSVTAGTNYYLGVLTSFSGTAPVAACFESFMGNHVLNGHYLCGSVSSQATMPGSITPSSLTNIGLLPMMYGR